MIWFLYFIAIISGILAKKNKIVTVYIIIVASIIFGYASNIPDLEGYRGVYNCAGNMNDIFYTYYMEFEAGYRYLGLIFHYFNISFENFRMFLFFSLFTIMALSIYKLSNKPNVLLALYMVYPFPIEVIQARNGLASCIVVAVMCNYIIREKNIFKFNFGIFIASLFHSASLIYLVFNLMFLNEHIFKRLYKYVLSIDFILIGLIYFNIFNLQKISHYFQEKTSFITIITFVVLISCLFIILLYSKKNIRLKNMIIFITGQNNIMYENRFMFIVLLFIPLLIFHFDFFRIIRNILIIINMLVLKNLSSKKLNYLINVSGILVILCIFVYRTCIYSYDPSLLELIIGNNIFFG